VESYLFTLLYICDHVLVCFVCSVDTGFGALDGQREGIHDHDRVTDDFSLHETHDFMWNAGSRVYDLSTKSA
jgi:hypothetical protein